MTWKRCEGPRLTIRALRNQRREQSLGAKHESGLIPSRTYRKGIIQTGEKSKEIQVGTMAQAKAQRVLFFLRKDQSN